MRKLTFIVILLISNLVFTQVEHRNDTIEIWTFSLGKFTNLNAEKIISEGYPF